MTTSRKNQQAFTLDRREFIKLGAMLAGSGVAASTCWGASVPGSTIPSFLRGQEAIWKTNPRKAALTWFQQAKFGLFMHYGLYSLLGRHEWVQFREKIPVAEYAKLKDRFTAEHFDADFITDLALEAGMKYVNITTRHHDSFCLFDSKYTDFTSVQSPARRDLVGELSAACQKKGLGLFLYYSHGRDWRHAHAPNNDQFGGSARPKYDHPDSHYKVGDEHDLQQYVQFMWNQITELLTQYGPIAGIWLDGIATPRSRPEKIALFHCQALYDHIHAQQPQVLVSYKQGLLGTEDFRAPERNWKGESDVPLEICDTLQPRGWGYIRADDGKHKTADQVMEMLKRARSIPANLLLNTGPRPDGSIHPEDVTTLREVGRRLQRDGFPA